MKCPLFIIALQLATMACAQIPEQKWMQLLGNPNVQELAQDDTKMIELYAGSSDNEKKQLLQFFTAQSSSNNSFVAARSLMWQGMTLARSPFSNLTSAINYMQLGIKKAIESGEGYLMVQCIDNCALNCRTFGKPEAALFYFLKSAELRKDLPLDTLPLKNKVLNYSIGDLLYQMQEYEQAIPYLLMCTTNPEYGERFFTSSLNTLALAYQKTKQKDSAMHWFLQALKNAEASNDQIWAAIVKGNIGA
jgi:tetratricopeptide (TPR) repeat protein